MATKSSISKRAFEELLEERREHEILRWVELEEELIYEIINYEFIDTSNGKSCVITLSDDNKVWSPLALTNRLKKFKPPKPPQPDVLDIPTEPSKRPEPPKVLSEESIIR